MKKKKKKKRNKTAKRVVVVHWNEVEARERAGRLGSLGYPAEASWEQDGQVLRTYRDDPPRAFVIDLSRLPSHGRAVGVHLRQQRGTREVPLVFVGGAPPKVARVKALMPDAEYPRTWRGVAGALKRSLARAPTKGPTVPGTMAGYSGTPLPKKLGIKAGSRVALLGKAPADFEATLGTLPDGVQLKRRARGEAGVVLLFVTSQAALARGFAAARRTMADPGRLWIAWPKKASGVASDLGQKDVRAFGLDAGLVDFKIAAIDATWSGLCFSRKKR